MPTPQDIVIVSIGPVQAYVSAARRTQDLRTASQVLSLLAQAACVEVGRLGGELIYPQAAAGEEGTPNRLVFLAPPGQGPDWAGRVVTAVTTLRDRLSARVLVDFERRLVGAACDHAMWAAQINTWLELYWVALPWDGAVDSYARCYRRAGLALDGRKGVRAYAEGGAGSEVCSLCGLRPALGGRDFWGRLRPHPANPHLVRPQERLCAVCTLKRWLPVLDDSPLPGLRAFPSTAAVASVSYLARLQANWDQVAAQGETWLAALEKLGLGAASQAPARRRLEQIDATWFYPDAYQVENIFKETGLRPERKAVEAARAALQALNRQLAGLGPGISHPSPYYAIALLDGDHMGRLLDQVDRRAQHGQISAVLARLAQSARGVVESYRGRVVYSGGDDLLALLPVDTVLAAVDDLQQAFHQQLAAAGFAEMHMSAGVAVAHDNAPLQTTIRLAHQAEQEAKHECGRNALVLYLVKRSGETRKAALKWSGADGAPAPLAQLQDLVTALSAGQISGKLAYDLWEEAHALAESEDLPGSERFECELLRLLKRHSVPAWTPPGGLAAMARQLAHLWDVMPYPPPPSRVEQIVQWLLVARFLAQGEQE